MNRVKTVRSGWALAILSTAGSVRSRTTDPLNQGGSASRLVKAGALQNAILTSANFSIIATDEDGVIQLFNVGAERMLGYRADEVINKVSPSDLHDPGEVTERAEALTRELGTTIAPGFEAPTVSPLAKPGWHAVRVLVPRADAQQIMDDLWAIGARAILVTDIAACRI